MGTPKSTSYANCLMRVVGHAANATRRLLVGLGAGESITDNHSRNLLNRKQIIPAQVTRGAVIALLLIAMMGLPAVSGNTSKKDVSKYKEQAEKYERMGRFQEAVQLYLNLAELSPEEQGFCYATVSRLYREEPFDSEGYALYREHITDMEQAVVYAKKAIAAASDYPGGHQELAESYEKLDMYEEAIPEWRKVIELATASERTSEYQQSWFRLAWMYDRTNQYDLAEEQCRKALEIVSDSDTRRQILRHLVRLYRSGERLDELFEQYEDAVEQEPTDSNALFDLSQLYVHRGEHIKAIPLYEKAVALKPDDVELYKDMIQLCRGMPVTTNSDETKLISDKELIARMKLYQLAPRAAGVGRILWLLRRERERDASLAFLEQLATSEPKDAALYRSMGYGYGRWGMHDQAITAYQKALTTAENQKDTVTRLHVYQELAKA